MLSEAEVGAGLALLANQLGLTSDQTINLSVSGGADSFSAQFGNNGLQSFAYGNSQAKVISQDVFIQNLLEAGLAGAVLVIVLKEIFK
jgi:hypothetical protein